MRMAAFRNKENIGSNDRRSSGDCIDSRLSQDTHRSVEEEYDGEILVSQLMLDRKLLWSKNAIHFKEEDDDHVLDSISYVEIDEIVYTPGFESDMHRNETTGRLDDSSEVTSMRSTTGTDFIMRKYLTRSTSLKRMMPSDGSSLGNTQGPRSDLQDESADNCPQQSELSTKENLPVIHIRTMQKGANAGRAYCFRPTTAIDYRSMIVLWARNTKHAKKLKSAKTGFRKLQATARKFYHSSPFQLVASALIMMNFAFTIAEAQLNKSLIDANKKPTPLGDIFDYFDIFFLCCFTAELAINLAGHWCRPFFRDRYNLVDLVVVLLSVIALGPWGLPMSVIRLIRSFRVLRLLSRFKALREIISALFESIIPVANAFTILLIIISVYSIVGVTYFDTSSSDDFAEFDKAFIALFQVVSSNTWIDSLPTHTPEGSVNFGNVLFMISFILVVGWTLLPISMAVLLNSFFLICERVEKEEVSAIINEARRADSTAHPMDPLLESITRNFVDDVDLANRISVLFKRMDEKDTNCIAFPDLCAAFRKLDFNPKIYISEADFASLTLNGSLCNQFGCIGPTEFDRMMRNQMFLFAQRTLSRALKAQSAGEEGFAQLAAMKIFSVHLPKEGLPNSSSGSDTNFRIHASAEATWREDGTRRVMKAVVMDDFAGERLGHCNSTQAQGVSMADQNPAHLFSKYHSLEDLRDIFRTILLPVVQELVQAQRQSFGSCSFTNCGSVSDSGVPQEAAGPDSLNDSDPERFHGHSVMFKESTPFEQCPGQIDLLYDRLCSKDSCSDVSWQMGEIMQDGGCSTGISSVNSSPKVGPHTRHPSSKPAFCRTEEMPLFSPKEEAATNHAAVKALKGSPASKPLIYSQLPECSVNISPSRLYGGLERGRSSKLASSRPRNTTRECVAAMPNGQIDLSSSRAHKQDPANVDVPAGECIKGDSFSSDTGSESSSGSTISRLAHSVRFRLAISRQENFTIEGSDSNSRAVGVGRPSAKDRRRGAVLPPCLRRR